MMHGAPRGVALAAASLVSCTTRRSFSSRVALPFPPDRRLSLSFPLPARLSSAPMSSQKSIKSYFKATPTKRPALAEANDFSPSKKTKPVTESTEGMAKEEEKAAGDSQRTESVVSDGLAAAIKKQAAVTPALSDNIGHSWFSALREEFSKKYFVTLSAYLDLDRRTHTVYPPVENVFTWTRHCDIKDVNVVILGQDPYHGPNQAHGLSFSVSRGVDPPPSLRNMYKELQSDIKGFRAPSHGDLTAWAEQGVLLLNAVLTVRAHAANSHANRGWEHLTDAVIKWLDRNNDHVVFLLWGGYAGKKSALIDAKKHLVLKAVHPSPLSASRGFFGCKHFSAANEFLQAHGKEPIDWKRLD